MRNSHLAHLKIAVSEYIPDSQSQYLHKCQAQQVRCHSESWCLVQSGKLGNLLRRGQAPCSGPAPSAPGAAARVHHISLVASAASIIQLHVLGWLSLCNMCTCQGQWLLNYYFDWTTGKFKRFAWPRGGLSIDAHWATKGANFEGKYVIKKVQGAFRKYCLHICIFTPRQVIEMKQSIKKNSNFVLYFYTSLSHVVSLSFDTAASAEQDFRTRRCRILQAVLETILP